MRTELQLWSTWCGPIFLILYVLAFWPLSGFVPPSPPQWTAADAADFYEGGRNAIRAGQLLCIVFSALLLPWFAVISVQMARIEGRFPLLAVVQIAGGTILTSYFFLVGLLWSIAAYNEAQNPELTLLIHNATWLIFVMAYPMFTVQMIAIAIAGFMDKQPDPIFPRWFCYLNLWVGVSAVAGGFATFFKTGPFAWNGLFAFWLPVTMFIVWMFAMFVLLRRGILRQAMQEAQLAPTSVA